jgi:cell division protein FtsB
VLLGALGWQLYQLHGRVETARAQETQLSADVEKKQQENDALQEKIDQGGSSQQMEEIARDQLGLVSPGEKVFYDVSN